MYKTRYDYLVIILIKFEIGLKMQKSQDIYWISRILEQSIIRDINKLQYVMRSSLTLIVRLGLLFLLHNNFWLGVCLHVGRVSDDKSSQPTLAEEAS